MRKYTGKIAFTLSEAMIVIVIMGVIGAIVIPQLKVENPTQRGWTTIAKKMSVNLTQATTEMLALNASLDDLTILRQGDKVFSIADADATPKMADLFMQYLSNIDMNVDTTKEYFSQDILDYKRNSTGDKINSYSNFHYAVDGVLVGYKFYGTCSATEKNANPPEETVKYEVTDSCGSVFFDINAYKKPNKLGSDQYIIPVGVRGMKYDNGIQ
ncbi:hypothetical protein IJ425_05515 [bacterium]|nr:hypothetical protein [bacterium]